MRTLYIIHILVRDWFNGDVHFFLQLHKRWSNGTGEPYLTLPTKKTVTQPDVESLDGSSLEHFVDEVM